jgi:acyl carrier protein
MLGQADVEVEMDDATFDAILRRRLKYLDADAALPDDAPLQELGLDSMQAVELLLDLEDQLGVVLPDDAMTAETFATPGSLKAAVAAAASDMEAVA